MNKLKWGVIASYGYVIINSVVSLLYTPVLLRFVGPSDYGIYQLVFSVVSYFGLLHSGLGSSYMRYYSKYKNSGSDIDIAKLNSVYLTILMVVSAVSLLGGSLLMIHTDSIFSGLTSIELEQTRNLIPIFLTDIIINFLFWIFEGYIIAKDDYFFIRILHIVRIVITPFFVIPVLFLGYGILEMAFVTVLINVILKSLVAYYAVKKLRILFLFQGIDTSLFREILVYCSFIFLYILAEKINWDIDKFLLGVYQNTETVALYSISMQLKSYCIMFSTSISVVFVPKVYSLMSDNRNMDKVSALFTKIGRLQFLIISMILGGLILLGKPFIYYWAGSDYTPAFVITIIMTVTATIPCIQTLGVEIQNAKNLHRVRCCLYFGIALVNLLVSIPTCQKYGVLGCVISTAVSTIVGHGFLMNVYYHKTIGIDMIYFWKEIFLLSKGIIVPYLFVLILTLSSLDFYNPILFIGFGSLYVVVFIVNIWAFGMNDYEKNLVLNTFAGAKNRFLKSK